MQHTTWLFFKDMPLNFFDLPIFADIKTFLHSTFYIKLLILSHLFYGTHPHKRTIALFNTSFIIVTLIIPLVKKLKNDDHRMDISPQTLKPLLSKLECEKSCMLHENLIKNVGVWPHIYAYVNNPFLSNLETTNGVLL